MGSSGRLKIQNLWSCPCRSSQFGASILFSLLTNLVNELQIVQHPRSLLSAYSWIWQTEYVVCKLHLDCDERKFQQCLCLDFSLVPKSRSWWIEMSDTKVINQCTSIRRISYFNIHCVHEPFYPTDDVLLCYFWVLFVLLVLHEAILLYRNIMQETFVNQHREN